jgi:SAM-dependent methyltransferase
MTAAGDGRARLKSMFGPRLTVLARCVLRDLPLPRWGNMRRIVPFSTTYGSDRGTPIDRYYLDRFLDSHRALITGRVLEVQFPSYTKRFGEHVRESHTVDINPEFRATYTCDLADAAQIPTDYYDCFLVPNTLQHLARLEPSLRTMLRIVKPGGTILLSAAGLLPLIPEGGDYWRMTAEGWRVVFEAQWPQCEIAVQSHGNCLSAAAAIYGLAHEELKAEELDAYDPRYPVLSTIRCRKPGGGLVQTT